MKNKILKEIILKTNAKTLKILNGLYKSIYKKQINEYKNIREYVLGDEIKNINWKASSKTQKLQIKEYESKSQNSFLLVLDNSNSMNAETNKYENKKEIVINIASILGYIIQNNDDKLSILFKQEIANIKNNFYELDNKLTNYKNNQENNTLHGSLKCIENIKTKHTIFIITDIKGVDNLDETLLKRITKKHVVFIININDNYHNNHLLNIDKNKRISTFFTKDLKLRKIEKELRSKLIKQNKKKLIKYKIGSITIETSEEIVIKLIKLLEERKRWINLS